MFGNESKPSRIYSFGSKGPTINRELVLEQMRLAHKYRNRLVEIERLRRTEAASALHEMFPHLDAQQAELETLIEALRMAEEAVNAAKAESRSNKVPKEVRAAAAEARKRYKAARDAFKLSKKDAYATEQWKLRQQELDAIDLERRKLARAECGVYWGTYLPIEQAMSKCRKGMPPRFLRYDGQGTCSVQIIGGMSVDDFLSGNSYLIRMAPGETLAVGKTSKVWLRVDSTDKGKPIWAELPVSFHRELPAGDDVEIKWVYLQRILIGQNEEYRLQFVLSRDEWPKDDAALDQEFGIDVGWRLVPDGLRVAYWYGSDGNEGELILPSKMLAMFRQRRELQQIRDLHMDYVRPRFAAWLRENAAILPEWMAEEAATVGQWKSTDRLCRLVRRWKDNRFDGDNAEQPDALEFRQALRLHKEHYGEPVGMHDLMEQWRRKCHHLHNWERSLHTKAIRWRECIYRMFAAKMRQSYNVAHIEAIDLRSMQELPNPEEDPDSVAVRLNRPIAAVSELLRCIRESVPIVHRHDPAGTTETCQCGAVVVPEDAGDLIWSCDECGAVWDRDRNAAMNLLRIGQRLSSGPVPEG